MFSKLNPFNMTDDELLNYSMNDKKNDYVEASPLQSINTTLQNNYTFYDPYAQFDREEIEDNIGAHVTSFYEKLNYQKPRFSKDATTENIVRDLNVREINYAFDVEQNMMNVVNNLFSSTTGNTPEERAKNQRIEKLLDEIRTFSKQYNLTQTQTEFLQNQVLSNHLSEYLIRKKQIETQDIQQQLKQQLETAGGIETQPETDDAMRDAMEEEDVLRHEGDGTGDIQHAGAHGGVAEEAKERDTPPPSTPDQPIGGVAGGRGGDLEEEEEEEQQSTVKQRQDGQVLYNRFVDAYGKLIRRGEILTGDTAPMSVDIKKTITLLKSKQLITLLNYVTKQGGSQTSKNSKSVVRALIYIDTSTDIAKVGEENGNKYKVNTSEVTALKNQITDLKVYIDTISDENINTDFP